MTSAHQRIVLSAHLLAGGLVACDVMVPLAEEVQGPEVPDDTSADGCDSLGFGDSHVLLAGQDQPDTIVVDERHVYWMNRPAGGPSSLLRVARNGIEPRILAGNLRSPWRLAMDEDALYWLDLGDPATRDDRVMRLPKAGGTPTPIAVALDGLDGLAVDGEYVYVSDSAIAMRIPKQGGVPEVISPPSESHLYDIAFDNGHVYLIRVSSSMLSIAEIGGATVEFATDVLGKVAVVDGYVYWIANGAARLLRASISGGPPVGFARGTYTFSDFTIASDRIYVPERDGIYQIDMNSGSIDLLVGGSPGNNAIALDATAIYYTNAGDGTVKCIPKNPGAM